MKFKYYLDKMPEQLKVQIARNVKAKRDTSKVDNLEQELTKEETVKAHLETMSKIERQALEIIVKQIGLLAFDENRLVQASEQLLTGAQIKVALIRLSRLGIIIAMRKMWGERLYVLPDDLFRLLRKLLWRRTDGEQAFSEKDVKVKRSAGRGLAMELFFLLTYVARNDIQMTQKGMIHKRHLLKMSGLLELKLPAPAEGTKTFRYAGQEAYTPEFAIVYDIALRLSLVRVEDGYLKLNMDRLGAWLHQQIEHIHSALYQIWEQIHMPDHVGMQHAIIELCSFPKGIWFPATTLIRSLATNGIIIDDGFVEHRLTDWVDMLCSLGWVEIGEFGGGAVFRWLIDAEGFESEMESDSDDGSKFIVQPDFEVIVPPSVPLAVRWELECMADHRRTDPVGFYSISKESIRRACEAGRKLDDCVDFLHRFSLYDVPEHIILNVKQWASQANRVRFEQVTLLRCGDEAIAREIRGRKECRPYLVADLGDKDFIVAASAITVLGQILESLGWTPSMQPAEAVGDAAVYVLSFPKLSAARLECTVDEHTVLTSGIVFPLLPMPDFDVEGSIPEEHEIYPQWKEIPPIWFKEPRRYHASVQRQIVAKAMEWQTSVQIRGNNEEWIVQPLKIETLENTFQLIGRSGGDTVVLPQHRWEEIRLMLPGIEDD